MSKPTEMNVGLTIGIPTLGRPVPLSWAWAFKSMSPPMNFNTVHSQVYGRPVAEARNMIVEEALKNGSRYLFFVGDDVVCPAHTLRQLIYRMEHNPEIAVCGGIYCSKSDPPAPLVFRGNGKGSYWDWKIGEFFEITGIGMDCTIIRASVFKELSEPWFVTEDKDKFIDGISAAEQWTEDLYFCHKLLTETKYKIFADATIMCEHWDVYKNKKYVLKKDALPMQRKAIDPSLPKAIDIGCGEVERQEQLKGYNLVRVDIRDECNPDYRCDIRQLPFDDKSFDIVFSSHVLEHFDRWEGGDILKEWVRLLKDDGEFILILPNIAWAAEYVTKNVIDEHVLDVLYGAQSNKYDYHKIGFIPATITKCLENNNLVVNDIKLEGYNMTVRAKRNAVSMVSTDAT